MTENQPTRRHASRSTQQQGARNPRLRQNAPMQSSASSVRSQQAHRTERPQESYTGYAYDSRECAYDRQQLGRGDTPVRASRARQARYARQNAVGTEYLPVITSEHEGYRDEQAQYGYGSAGTGGTRPEKKMGRAKKAILGFFSGFLVVLIGAGALAAVWLSGIGASLGFDDEGQLGELKEALVSADSGKPFYMLVLGSDARGDETSRSDVIMLARLDSSTGTVHLISIPRDTMVTIEGHGTNKINAAYAYGGPALAVKTVSEFAGVPISHYAEIHFDELESLVDMLGGVTVNVPESFSAGNGGVSLSAGEQVLNGEQALGFARERYNVSGGDFGRAQAQRLVAEAIIREVLATSPTELPGVITEAAGCVSTDMGLTSIISLAFAFQGHDLNLYSAACPSYTSNINGVSYVCTMFDEWRTMMQLVDAGMDPENTSAKIPQAQLNNEALGAATNSPAPRDYHATAANALTTDDVAKAG